MMERVCYLGLLAAKGCQTRGSAMMPPRIRGTFALGRGELDPSSRSRPVKAPILTYAGAFTHSASRNQWRAAIGDLVRLLPENYCAATLRGTLQPY